MAPPRVRSQSAGLGSYSDRKKSYKSPVRQDKMMKQSMGPGQSMAMSGSPNLASYSERDINALRQATQNLGQAMSFQDIAKAQGERASQYRRGANINKSLFGDDSGRQFTPSMFDSRGNLMLFTAKPPTLGQMFGDIGRAFTGYDSLKYPRQEFQGPFPVGQNRNLPYMKTTPGMLSGITDYITGGGMLGRVLGAGKDLFNKGIGAFKGASNVFKGESQFAPTQASGSIPNSRERSMAGLSPLQQQIYNSLMQIPGKTHSDALAAAQRQNYNQTTTTQVSPTFGQNLNNLTEFGQILANRVRSENPSITNDQLLNNLQRMSDAGFNVSNPVFNFAMGGIATLN